MVFISKSYVKRGTAIFIALLLFAFVFKAETFAASSSSVTTVVNAKTVSLSGYKHYKTYKLTTYMSGTLSWASGVKAKFTGSTGGKYSGSTKADIIKHYDEATINGIGSVSISGSPSATISGSSVQWTYSAKTTTSITNKPTYYYAKGITISVTITSSTLYTWGSTNYRVCCGDAS